LIRVLECKTASFQDMGRGGYTDIGLSHSGALDEFSYLYANALLGDREKVCIEAFGDFSFEAMRDFSFSVCGAKEVLINLKPYRAQRSYKAKKGDTVYIKGGLFYICAKNGFDAPKVFGSCSVSFAQKILQPLQKGDVLRLKHPQSVPVRHGFEYSFDNEIRVIGECGFKEIEIENVTREKALVKGSFENKKEVFEGVNFSLLGVKEGRAFIALKEYPSIDRVAKIADILPVDCFKIAKKPGRYKVKTITLETAKKEMIEFYSFFKKLHFTYVQMYH